MRALPLPNVQPAPPAPESASAPGAPQAVDGFAGLLDGALAEEPLAARALGGAGARPGQPESDPRPQAAAESEAFEPVEWALGAALPAARLDPTAVSGAAAPSPLPALPAARLATGSGVASAALPASVAPEPAALEPLLAERGAPRGADPAMRSEAPAEARSEAPAEARSEAPAGPAFPVSRPDPGRIRAEGPGRPDLEVPAAPAVYAPVSELRVGSVTSASVEAAPWVRAALPDRPRPLERAGLDPAAAPTTPASEGALAVAGALRSSGAAGPELLDAVRGASAGGEAPATPAAPLPAALAEAASGEAASGEAGPPRIERALAEASTPAADAAPEPPLPTLRPEVGGVVGAPAPGGAAAPASGPTVSSLPVDTPAAAIPDRVAWLVEQGGGHARVRLQPAELGEVELSVRVRGGSVELQVLTEGTLARSALLHAQDRLGEALAARDLRIESIEIRETGAERGALSDGGGGDLADSGGRDPSRTMSPRPRGAGIAGVGPQPSATPEPARAPGAGIDLRV